MALDDDDDDREAGCTSYLGTAHVCVLRYADAHMCYADIHASCTSHVETDTCCTEKPLSILIKPDT